MKIFFSQIYIQAGIKYPFSQAFQNWLSERIGSLVKPSEYFIKTYGDDYKLIFNISAKTAIEVPEIKGPTLFKRDKDIEYTIFIPHRGPTAVDGYTYQVAFDFLIDGVISVLQALQIDVSVLEENTITLRNHLSSDPIMIRIRN